MGDPWIWALLLLVIGLSLSIMEIFFPSGGMLGFLAAAALVAAGVMAFRQSLAMGIAVLLGILIGAPLLVMLAFQFWPKTAMGRRMLLAPPAEEDVRPDHPKQRQLKSLIGRVGRAKSTMLPSGAVVIDGRTIDATSEGVPIEVGQPVQVIAVRANRAVVRPVEEEQTSSPDAADPLRRPIDSIGPDPFGEPPA